MPEERSGQAPTIATQAPDDVLWTRGRRDGGLAHEEDLWRASAAASPPVWMRDFTARRAASGGAK